MDSPKCPCITNRSSKNRAMRVVLLFFVIPAFCLCGSGCPETTEGVDYILFGAVKNASSNTGIALVEVAVDGQVVEFTDSTGYYDYALLSRGAPPVDTVLVSYSKGGFQSEIFKIPGDLEIVEPNTRLDVSLSVVSSGSNVRVR